MTPARGTGRTQRCSAARGRDEAHYGLFDVGGRDLQAALRQAGALVKFADQVRQRST